MREVIEKIKRKLYANSIGEQTEYKIGYADALNEVIELIEDGITELIIPNNDYYVIMYHNGDKYLPYVEKMRLYKIFKGKATNFYYFSKNMNATIFNTKTPDLKLGSLRDIKKRVFFSRENAEEAIKE